MRAVEDFEALRSSLIGRRFPGGVFSVERFERHLSHEAMLSEGLPDDTLHPVWILLGALRGMGMTTEELVALAQPGQDDGVLFGESSINQLEPLRIDIKYSVGGEITDIRRRVGKRTGVLDLLSFTLRIADEAGDEVASADLTYVVTRSGTADD